MVSACHDNPGTVATLPRPDPQLSPGYLDPSAHTRQTVALGSASSATTVIADGQNLVIDLDEAGVGLRVTHHIRHRLAQHPSAHRIKLRTLAMAPALDISTRVGDDTLETSGLQCSTSCDKLSIDSHMSHVTDQFSYLRATIRAVRPPGHAQRPDRCQ